MVTVPNSSRKLIEKYFDYLEKEKQFSWLTIRNYKHYLTRFAEWFSDKNKNKEFSSIDQEVVNGYLKYLLRFIDIRGKHLSAKTQGYHAIALRGFLKWLNKNNFNVVSFENVTLPKVAPSEFEFLAGEEVNKLLDPTNFKKIQGKRDKAMLEVLFSTGLRVSELASLNRQNVDIERKEFKVLGKKKISRTIFISSRAIGWLTIYLEARKDNFKPMFIRHSGKLEKGVDEEKMRLTVRSIQRMIKKYAKKAGLDSRKVTPKSLRHSFAIDLLIAGSDIGSIKEMLGHKNVSTTQIYTHVTNKHLKDIHESFHGRGRK